MVFRFYASEVREQIAHARRARLRDAGVHAHGLLEPSLILKRRGGRVFLISNGIPESDNPADALGFGTADPVQGEASGLDPVVAAKAASAKLDSDEDIGPADFAEGIAVTAFENVLADRYVSIIVRRTYINILGRRRLQPVEVSSEVPYRHGMRLIAGAKLGEVRHLPKKTH